MFEPWQHGPVNRTIFAAHRSFGSASLPPLAQPALAYPSAALTEVLEDVIEVYGRLSPWRIRCESHLEQPWIAAYEAKAHSISEPALRDHFERKLAPAAVQLPAYLSGAADGAVDGLPTARFESLHALADALRASDARR